MDIKAIFVKTSKGDDETTSKTSHLYGDIKRVMGLVDNKSTVAELTKRAAPSLRESMEEMLQKLLDSGFIQENGKVGSALKISIPTMTTNKAGFQSKDADEELDFTGTVRAPDADEQVRLEAAAKVRAEDEAARIRAEQEAARISAELAAAEAKARHEAEAKARTEVEVARLKAEQEVARVRAERAAVEAKARAEAEAARLKAEQEAARIRMEREAAHARVRAEAEARLKAEQEAAQVKMRAEADAARLKAEQEASRIKADLEVARARERTEAQTKARAAAEAARLKAGQEAAQAKAYAAIEAARIEAEQKEARILAELAAAQAAEKMEAEARIKAQSDVEEAAEKSLPPEQSAEDGAPQTQQDEQTSKLAQAQAKVWADAEQRARAQVVAQAKHGEVKSAAQQDTKEPQPDAVHRVRKIRKPLPWGKVGVSLAALLLAAVIFLPYVWPMQSYVAKIEHELSMHLQQPVSIGTLQITLLPQPKMELQNVSVGGNDELRADKIALTFGVASLFAQAKKISIIEIENLTFSAKSFSETLPWLQAVGSLANYPVTRLVLQHVHVSEAGLDVPVMQGSIDFNRRGNLVKAVLSSADGKLSAELRPQQSYWQISLSVRDSALPLLPQINFNELNMNGTVDGLAASFKEIDGYLYGGRMTGSVRLAWQNGWQMQGQLNVKNMDLQNMLPQFGIVGKLDGDTKLTMRGEALSLLTKAPRLDGKFVVKNGLINKIDMVELAMTPGRQETSGGRTHFDELGGTLLADTDGQHLRQIRISAGVMSARGYLDVAPGKQPSDKKLTGRMDVDLKMRAEMGSVPLLVTGTVAEPVLRAGR